jgi:hypothetical protein
LVSLEIYFKNLLYGITYDWYNPVLYLKNRIRSSSGTPSRDWVTRQNFLTKKNSNRDNYDDISSEPLIFKVQKLVEALI